VHLLIQCYWCIDVKLLQALRFKKAHVTHPDLKATFCLPIIGVKKNPTSPLYTSLGVITKGTLVEVRDLRFACNLVWSMKMCVRIWHWMEPSMPPFRDMTEFESGIVRFQQFFANPKSGGFSNLFVFGFSFCFAKPTFIIHYNSPLAIQK